MNGQVVFIIGGTADRFKMKQQIGRLYDERVKSIIDFLRANFVTAHRGNRLFNHLRYESDKQHAIATIENCRRRNDFFIQIAESMSNHPDLQWGDLVGDKLHKIEYNF